MVESQYFGGVRCADRKAVCTPRNHHSMRETYLYSFLFKKEVAMSPFVMFVIGFLVTLFAILSLLPSFFTDNEDDSPIMLQH